MTAPAIKILPPPPQESGDWMTYKEAMEFLRFGRTKLNAITIRMQDKREPGRIRATEMEGNYKLPPVRLWAADVRALLQGPKGGGA